MLSLLNHVGDISDVFLYMTDLSPMKVENADVEVDLKKSC
jgi:hypothetical protein